MVFERLPAEEPVAAATRPVGLIMAAPDCGMAPQRMSLADGEENELMESAWMVEVTGVRFRELRATGLRVRGVTHVT
jgi:hypothetical protein